MHMSSWLMTSTPDQRFFFQFNEQEEGKIIFESIRTGENSKMFSSDEYLISTRAIKERRQ